MLSGAPRHPGGCVPRPLFRGVPPESGVAPRSRVPFATASGSRRTHRPTGLPAAVPTPAGPVDSKEQMMASEQQLERSMLDGKDREELHAIAGAMGVKGITRLRKADLVDAILAAAAGRAGGAGN
ncbi:MAG: Rho termination factor N-terminal domain-containing protein, partial [Acidimicrobiia bacterium]